MRKRRNWLPLLAVLVMAVLAMTTGAFAAGEEAAEYVSPFHATAWSLLPPVIAIGLALITKEVYCLPVHRHPGGRPALLQLCL